MATISTFSNHNVKLSRNNLSVSLLLLFSAFIFVFTFGGCGNSAQPGRLPTSSPTPVVTATPNATPTPTPIPDLTYINNWYHFGYDAQYTGHNPQENIINPGNVAQLEEKWVLGRNDGLFATVYGAPAVYHGRMFFDYVLTLIAVSARTGQFLWSFANKGIVSEPVVSEDGLVFCFDGTSPSDLYAVNYESGEQIWKSNTAFNLGLNHSMITVDESNGIVYVVEDDYWGNPYGDDKKLYALSKQTGAALWSIGASDNVSFKGNHILLKNGKIFAAAHDLTNLSDNNQHILQINPATHQIEAVFPQPALGTSRDIIDFSICNNLLIVSYFSVMVAYDLTDQSVLWQNTNYSGTPSCNPTKNVIYVSGLVDLHASLIAVNAATGQEIWHYSGRNNFGYNPTIANGIVYFITGDGYMIALNENTGAQLFSYPFGGGGGETTQVAVNDGMLFFSGNGSSLGDFVVLGLPQP